MCQLDVAAQSSAAQHRSWLLLPLLAKQSRNGSPLPRQVGNVKQAKFFAYSDKHRDAAVPCLTKARSAALAHQSPVRSAMSNRQSHGQTKQVPTVVPSRYQAAQPMLPHRSPVKSAMSNSAAQPECPSARLRSRPTCAAPSASSAWEGMGQKMAPLGRQNRVKWVSVGLRSRPT